MRKKHSGKLSGLLTSESVYPVPVSYKYLVHMDEEVRVYIRLGMAIDGWRFGLKYSRRSWLEIVTP